MKPRLALLIGATFVIVDIVYFTVPAIFGGRADVSAMTMLAALAIAMTVMFYVLMAGVQGEQ